MSSFLKAIIIGCRIIDWHNSSRTSKISSLCLLDAIVPVEKPIQNLIFASLKIMSFFFFSSCFQYFLLVFDFQQFDHEVPRCSVLCINLIEVCNFPKSLPNIFYQFWKFVSTISSDIDFTSFFSLLFLGLHFHVKSYVPTMFICPLGSYLYFSSFVFLCISLDIPFCLSLLFMCLNHLSSF